MERLLPPLAPEAFRDRWPVVVPARGPRRYRVGLMLGCVQRLFDPAVNSAAINYYFRSKEVLISRCMDVTLENAFGQDSFIELVSETAVERCKELFRNLVIGGCNYPGLTRSHYYELISFGNYNSRIVEKTNQFIEDLMVDLNTHGAILPNDELRLACMQITSAIMLMILTPRLFEKNFGVNLCEEDSRKLFIDRLVDRLLV
jgi:AcrR family transcriptional regulator